MTTRDADYFSEKYGLTRTHSEVLHAATIVPPGRALDLGCGNGRNSLYLAANGHQLIFLVIGEQNTRFIQQTRKFVEHGKYLQKIMSPEALTLTGPGMIKANADYATGKSARQAAAIRRCDAASPAFSTKPAK